MVRAALRGPAAHGVTEGPARPRRLAVVASHPIQYFSPWFRRLGARRDLAFKVFYLWDSGVRSRRDEGFGHDVVWDIPLLDGYEHEFVPNRSPRPGTQRFGGLWNPAIVERLLAFRPDAILLFGYNYATMLRVVFSRRLRGIPLLFRGDSHRIVARKGAFEPVRRALIARVFRRFCAFLHVGSANREYFVHHGVTDDRLFLAPHAVDNDRFLEKTQAAGAEAAALRRSLGIPDDHAVVLFAGKLEPVKRPHDLLQAFVRSDPPKATLVFVGAGELASSLRAAAGGRPGIVFAPFQNQSMMPAVYAAADVVVLPSESETWGLAVNEAMCMARAVIVSDHVGCARDLVASRATGLVFESGNVEALAEALTTALSDRDRLREWGANARAAIRAFSYDHATEGLMRALAACAPRAART